MSKQPKMLEQQSKIHNQNSWMGASQFRFCQGHLSMLAMHILILQFTKRKLPLASTELRLNLLFLRIVITIYKYKTSAYCICPW